MLSYPAYKDWKEQELLKRKLEAELQKLERDNAKLKEEIEKLNSPDYVEMLAREKFGLVKPGEKPYLVISPEESVSEETTETTSPPPDNIWLKIKVFFHQLLKRD